MDEIQWTNGMQEYSRQEIAKMLQTQRAMIINDIKYLLIDQAERQGIKGNFTKDGTEIYKAIDNCRKVVF